MQLSYTPDTGDKTFVFLLVFSDVAVPHSFLVSLLFMFMGVEHQPHSLKNYMTWEFVGTERG